MPICSMEYGMDRTPGPVMFFVSVMENYELEGEGRTHLL